MMHDHEKMIRHAMIIARHLASGGHVHLTHRRHLESGGDGGGSVQDSSPSDTPAPAPSTPAPQALDPVKMKGAPLDWAHLNLPASFTQGFVPSTFQNVARPPAMIASPESYTMPDAAALAQPPKVFSRGGYADGGETNPMLDQDQGNAANPYADQTVSEYRPTMRDRIANSILNLGDRSATGGSGPSESMKQAVQGITGSLGAGTKNLAALDFVPVVGQGLGVDEALREGDYKGAAMAAMPVPAAKIASAATSPIVREAETVLKNAQLPNLRTMPVEDALAIARQEPHLIPAAKGEESAYVGGPRNVKSKEDLEAIRRQYDANVAQDPRGWDWYDRYRKSMNDVTGGNPLHNEWMSAQEGQWSAGVSPEGELGFAIKENNGALTGFPVKSARPAQHEAHMRAIAANDPSLYQLGEKTGEYAEKVNPDKNLMPTATGVNDFRHARELGYTEASGEPQRNALGSTQHNFADYETALAVDRANQTQLGGRSDWTGEQMQAAPWVRQKANDILEQRPNMIAGYIKQGMTPEAARAAAYEDAFQLANKTIGDFFDKHTAFATHEAFPGADTGHLPLSVGASQNLRDLYSLDPRSTWATAPNNRDAIYSGLQLGDTGVAGRVRPTIEMTGMYTPPSGVTEQNLGEVARPLVGFHTNESGTKSLPAGDRAMLEAGETLRAAVDAQNAGAAHIHFVGGRPQDSNSFFLPMDRRATPEEITALQAAGAPHGLPDVSDTGQGLTLTRFYPEPPVLGGKGYTNPIGPTLTGVPLEANVIQKAKDVARDITAAAPQAQSAMRTNVDSVYADLIDKWKQGIGSGAVTKEVLDKINVTPEMRQAFDKNPYIAQNALDRIARDEAFASQMGATRQDIQNFRRVIGDGPGWVGRLEEGLKNGAVLPALAAAVLVGTTASNERQ
jgi:hypothetical protein